MPVYVDGLRAPHEHYQRILDILGPTGVIIPIGDPLHENEVLAQVETVGEDRQPFTYSEPLSAWDTVPYILGPAQIPILTFNGTDEEADTPDLPYWSRGDGSDDFPFSIGVWANMDDVTAVTLLSKYDAGGGVREWLLQVNGAAQLELQLFDQSAGVNCFRVSNVARSADVWTFLVVTYDGRGGSAAANGIKLYADGSVLVGTSTTNASYVAMENTAEEVVLAARDSGAVSLFNGKMAGGPLGPHFVQRELPSADVSDLWDVGRAFLGE